MPTNPLSRSEVQPSALQFPIEEKPILTDPEFTGGINNFLEEGIKNNHSQDYVAGEIYDLAKQNPTLAKDHQLTDYQAVKAGVASAYEFDREWPGNRPVVMQDATGFDLFMMGVEADLRRQERDRPLSEEERRRQEETDRALMRNLAVVGGVTVAVVGGVGLAPVAARAGQWLMGVAATPRGQELIGNTVECVGAMIPGTPPPATKIGFQCAGAQKVKEILKDHFDGPEK